MNTVIGSDRAIARTVINRVAEARDLAPPWPETGIDIPKWLATADVSDWGPEEIGAARRRLADAAEIKQQGMDYTPKRLADFTTRFAFEAALENQIIGDAPEDVLRVVAIDPTCGAGIFLVAAARWIAARYAGRLATQAGLEGGAPAWAVRKVLPFVATECVFGVDNDPIAVDLARSVLWLEMDGRVPFDFMDRNVIVGNVLEKDLPPALVDRYLAAGVTPPEIGVDSAPTPDNDQLDLFGGAA